MPFVIGVLGTPRTKEKVDENAVSIAQRKAAQHSEFRGNVLPVESYKDYSNFSHSIFEKGWPPISTNGIRWAAIALIIIWAAGRSSFDLATRLPMRCINSWQRRSSNL